MADREKIFDKIISPVIGFTEEAGNSLPGDFDTYKLSFVPFLNNLLFAVICNIKSISLLVTEIKTSATARELGLTDASKSMYSEAFARYRADMFRKIFYQLLISASFLHIPEISHLGKLLIIDGSFFPAILTMEWAEYRKNANAIKLHLAFELNRMIPVRFLTTDGKYSERKFLRSIIEEGVTYICDRGYVSFPLFSEISGKCAYFIIRGKENMKYSVHETLSVNVPDIFLKFLENIHDFKVIFSNDKNNTIYRIVNFSAGDETYVLITNRPDLTTYEVIMLYAYRWQIELFFRFLKRTLRGIHLMSHDPNGIQIQFYVYMISYLLLLKFRQECHTIAGTGSKSEEIRTEKYESDDLPGNTHSKGSERFYVCGLVSFLGEKLRIFWKIGLHWLTAVKNHLLSDFNIQIVRKLSTF